MTTDDTSTTSTTPPLPTLATAEEIAKETRLGRHQVYAWAREGKIPCVRIGRAVRFSRAAVAEWIARGGTAPAGDEA